MSVHEIYYKGGAKMMRPILSREEYLKRRGGERQKAVVKAVREGKNGMKRGLVQMNYSCLPNADGSLKGSTSMSATVGMDIDHVDEARMTEVKECILAKKDELGLLMLEVSARQQGFHLVFKRRKGMGQEDNLRWASQLLGVEFDKGAKDITRVFFTTTDSDEDLLLLDDALFDNSLWTDEAPAAEPAAEPAPSAAQTSGADRTFPLHYHGIPFTDILQKYWELNNGGFEPTVGDRDMLTFQLASDLRHICGKSFGWLDQVIPCYDGFTQEEKQQKIRNALALKYEGMPLRLKTVLEALRNEGKNMAADDALQPSASPLTSEVPKMPHKLPALIELLTSKTPDEYKPAVAHAVFPPLATHLCGVRFEYTDNVEHEATLMNCLMAGTGAGKGCIDQPIDHIMADIKRRDKENERRETEWKRDCQKRGANKDRMARPEGLVIQIIDPDMTKPALVTRMDEAEGHFTYVKLNELDLFDQLKGPTGRQHFQLMCLAFDPGAEYGQTRVGTQSVTARPRCRFNWNACTTVQKGRRYFSKVLTDGPISRINFCTIPEQEIGCEQPVYGKYDAAFDEALKPYIDHLVEARGLTDCPPARRLALKMQQECAEVARLSQNGVYWNLSHRACVIAWLKACVLYVANGMKWEKTIEDFVRWSLRYDLWCKMEFFGEDIGCADREAQRAGTRGPRNLLEMLPDTFTLEDARRVRREQGLSAGAPETSHMVMNWKSRKYVSQISDSSFEKRKFRKDGKVRASVSVSQ